jgi:hypothetical protein
MSTLDYMLADTLVAFADCIVTLLTAAVVMVSVTPAALLAFAAAAPVYNHLQRKFRVTSKVGF